MGCDGADTARPLIWACDIIMGFAALALLSIFGRQVLLLVLKLQLFVLSGVVYWLDITADRAAVDLCGKSLFDRFRYSVRLQDFDVHIPFFANALLFLQSLFLFPAPQ